MLTNVEERKSYDIANALRDMPRLRPFLSDFMAQKRGEFRERIAQICAEKGLSDIAIYFYTLTAQAYREEGNAEALGRVEGIKNELKAKVATVSGEIAST